jgi:NADH-quinone oxidoreductase subunit A
VGFYGFRNIAMTDNYFVRYLPLLIHFSVACLLAAAIVTLSYLVGQHKANKSKMSPYECGMEPVGDVRQRFSVKFYLVGMLFILFDVEAVFLYPWAVLLKRLKMFGFWEMMTYVLIILVGFLYVWQKGVLDWNKTSRDEAL